MAALEICVGTSGSRLYASRYSVGQMRGRAEKLAAWKLLAFVYFTDVRGYAVESARELEPHVAKRTGGMGWPEARARRAGAR